MAELFQYFRTRFLRWPVILLSLALLVTLLLSAGTVEPLALWPQAAFVLAAIFTFRLWDDLADREYDRRRHPDRVIVQARDLRPYVAMVAAGLALLALALRDDTRYLLVFLGFTAMLAVLYHGGVGKALTRSARASLVLVKYPLFVHLLVTPSRRAWLAGVALYLLLLVCEWRDDADLRNTAVMPLVLAACAGIAVVSALYWSAGAWS
ncbi:MAG: hypothetical protein L0Y45_04550 [Woeseiaceae bacterium]|nr:hypothetical protein [Woeseiaceae bacterium]